MHSNRSQCFKCALLVALILTLSGCVTQLPQTASPEVYDNYNRARYGNPSVSTPSRR